MFMDQSALWNKMKLGDKSAYEQIYRLYIHQLLKYGARLCTDQTLVEDCIQELFVEIWQRRKNLGLTNNIGGYLILSLKRKLIKKIKHSQKTNSLDVDIPITESVEKSDGDQLQRVKDAMHFLSEREREVIHLRFEMELEYEEIGKIMDLKYQSVRNQLHRAISKLRGVLSIFYWLLINLLA